jgi:hypothetical protein
MAIEPDMKVTNKHFPSDQGGGGSTRVVDAEKREAIESFLDDSLRLRYRIIYQLDDRLQPITAVYKNKAGRIFQQSKYTLSETFGPKEVARIDQELVYDANGNFVCTKNYIYGTGRRTGSQSVIRIDTYDATGALVKKTNNPIQTYQPTAPPVARPVRPTRR